MRYLLALFLVLMAPSALAQDMIARQGADSVRLTQSPCPPAVLSRLEQGTRGHYRHALAVVNGKEYVGCWALLNNGNVHLQYADGDQGLLDMRAFEPAPNT